MDTSLKYSLAELYIFYRASLYMHARYMLSSARLSVRHTRVLFWKYLKMSWNFLHTLQGAT